MYALTPFITIRITQLTVIHYILLMQQLNAGYLLHACTAFMVYVYV